VFKPFEAVGLGACQMRVRSVSGPGPGPDGRTTPVLGVQDGIARGFPARCAPARRVRSRVRSRVRHPSAGMQFSRVVPAFWRVRGRIEAMNTNNDAGARTTQLTFALPATLIDEIAHAVAERLRDGDLVPARSPWLDVQGASDYLAMNADAVCKAAQRGFLPAHQPFGKGSRCFFHQRELDGLQTGENQAQTSRPTPPRPRRRAHDAHPGCSSAGAPCRSTRPACRDGHAPPR
jgi:hypothetical protein